MPTDDQSTTETNQAMSGNREDGFTQETSSEPEQEEQENKQQKTQEEEPEKETKEEKPSTKKDEEDASGVKKKIQTESNQTSGTTQTQVKDELTEEVEDIMEQGLEDAFGELTPTQQQEFKLKGEETARKISDLIRQGKTKVKKIFELIFEWLKELPGINRFFLEQEAKIKADKIAKLEESKYETNTSTNNQSQEVDIKQE